MDLIADFPQGNVANRPPTLVQVVEEDVFCSVPP